MEKITWQTATKLLGIIVIVAGFATVTDLFGVLFQLKGIDYTYTGDITCGSECESYINLTTSYWRVCFADYENTKYENETLFKKRSRSRTLHVNLANVKNVITTQKLVDDGPNRYWVPYDIEVDWLVPTYGKNWRAIKDGDCWDRGKVNKIKLVGHKNPEDNIKWSFRLGTNNSHVDIDIDPLWKASVKWHDNCQTREENGKFNVIIGRTFWVNDSDNKCKPVEEANSLKNSPIKCVVDFDGIHKAKCLDFNLTHRKIRFDATDIEMKDRAKMVIKIMKPNYTVNGTEMVEKAKTIRSFVVDPIQDMWINVNFSEVIHFGDNSTTIQLQDNETENLNDDDIYSSGDSTYFYIDDADSGSYGDAFGMFNISAISVGQTIDEAKVYLYGRQIGHMDVDDIVGCWGVNNHTWNEEDGATTNLRTVDGTNIFNQTNIISIAWYNWTVTNWVSTEYNNGDKNVSFGFYIFEDADSVDDWFTCQTKEYTTDITKRPYLNITYSAAADTTKPTYSSNGHNTTTAGASVLFYLQYNDDTALNPDGQYIFSTNNTGAWANESAVNFTATPNWANKSMTLNSTSGLSIGYRWYADDNAGNINNTGIFALTTTSADTCTYSGSGNWAILCSDNCALVSTDLKTNNFTLLGAGTATGVKNIYNYTDGMIRCTNWYNE